MEFSLQFQNVSQTYPNSHVFVQLSLNRAFDAKLEDNNAQPDPCRTSHFQALGFQNGCQAETDPESPIPDKSRLIDQNQYNA